MPFDRFASAGYMTNWAARLFARSIDRRLKPLGLASGQLPVFFALADGGTSTQAELAEAAAIEQPTMAATLKRMEASGLIRRTADPADRRRTAVALTPEAEENADRVLAAVRTVNEAALSRLDAAERAQFLALLARVTEGLEESLAD